MGSDIDSKKGEIVVKNELESSSSDKKSNKAMKFVAFAEIKSNLRK